MPPTSDGRTYTVGCRLSRLVPDAAHVEAIERGVQHVHKATFLASELANLHVRRCIHDNLPLGDLFSANWLYNLYNEVTNGKGKPKVVAELRKTRDEWMPPYEAPVRTGVLQCLLYECRNLAAVAETNVWKHFAARVHSHVRCKFALSREAYDALSGQEKKQRSVLLLKIAHDLIKPPEEVARAPDEHAQWVSTERARVGIDEAVGAWNKKPLLYHLKAQPHRFVRAMALMSHERESSGGSSFALFPLRHTYVPRHVRFDQRALRELLKLGSSEHTRKKSKSSRSKSVATENDEIGFPPLGPCGYDSDEPPPLPPLPPPAPTKKRNRRAADELVDEKAELFGQVVDLRAAGIKRCNHFDFAFTTDGVCARVQMKAPNKQGGGKLTSMPSRGLWAIDELKRVSRLDQLHVVGVDPGKRELVVGVDMDDPKDSTAVRYTQKQRQFEMRTKQYRHEGRCNKPCLVAQAEAQLKGFNSRSADLPTFYAYCAKRHERLDLCLAFYSGLDHRRRRWKGVIKEQQSEEKLFKRLEGIKKKGDNRPLVLAYGSWGMVAGRPGAACNKGNAPCIGVGLMRKLAKRFVVSPTPEAYTSKTCCKCLGPCGRWKEVEEATNGGKQIRGLRLCQTEDCKLPLNRDRNGATNIGTNFKRLFQNLGPIRSMSEEDLRLHRLRGCFTCD